MLPKSNPKKVLMLYRRLQRPKNHIKNENTSKGPGHLPYLISRNLSSNHHHYPTLLTVSQSLSQTRPLSDSGPSTAASISGNPHWSIPKPAASNRSPTHGFLDVVAGSKVFEAPENIYFHSPILSYAV